MDDLLIKYILKEATPEESGQVQQWLASDAAKHAHFERLQAVWQLASQPNLQPVTDVPQALRRLKQTLKAREMASVKRIWPRLKAVAAAVVGITSLALGAYVWMKPKTIVNEQPPVVQPDTVLQKPLRVDTVPKISPVPMVPALHTDTLHFVKPHKKKLPRVTPVQPVRIKKKTAAQQPTQPVNATPVKKKQPVPAQRISPVKKHKSATSHRTPQVPVKEPTFS